MNRNSTHILPQEDRYGYIDFLKACSAIVIMLYHIPGLIVYEDLQELYPVRPLEGLLKPIYTYGYTLVELFFILSGFLLSVNYFMKKKDDQSLSCFMGRKAIRLYPMFLLTTCLCSILQYFSLCKTGSTVLKVGFNLNFFWLDLLMLRAGIIAVDVPLNVPAWFLSPLFVCYFLFWIIFYEGKEKTKDLDKAVLFSILLILVGITTLYKGWNTAIFNERMGQGLAAFFSGVLLGVDKEVRGKEGRRKEALLCSVILFFISVFLMGANLSGNRYIPTVFMFIVFVFILDNLKAVHTFINTKLCRMIYKPMYDLSYAIFLSHYPVLIGIAILNRIFNIARFYSEWWFLAVYIFCSILLAFLMKKLEGPTRLFLKNLLG